MHQKKKKNQKNTPHLEKIRSQKPNDLQTAHKLQHKKTRSTNNEQLTETHA